VALLVGGSPRCLTTYLVIVLYFKDEVLDHSFSHLYMSIDDQTKCNKVRVPVIQLNESKLVELTHEHMHLIETCSRNNEGYAPQRLSSIIILCFLHRECKNARLIVQAFDKHWVVTVLWELKDLQSQVWSLSGNRLVVFEYLLLSIRYIDPRREMACSILWVGADDLQSVAIDATGEGTPEGCGYHAA